MDVTPAIATIVAAFADDPVERWLYPEEAEYLEHFPRFVEAFAGAGMVSPVEDFAAVAVWLPPGAEPDGDAIGAVYTETVDPAKHDDMFAVAGQMDDAHPALRALVPAVARRAAGAAGRRPRRRAAARRGSRASTPTGSRPTSRRPTRARSRSTSATGSRSPRSLRRASARP